MAPQSTWIIARVATLVAQVFFLHCFQTCLQIVFKSGWVQLYTLCWLQLVDFSCFSECLLTLFVDEDVELQWLHFFGAQQGGGQGVGYKL